MAKTTIQGLVLLSLLCSVARSAPVRADDAKPMNILVLYADDWRHDTLGIAGNSVVKTPTIDTLANKVSALRKTA